MSFDLRGLSEIQALGNGKRFLAYDSADSITSVLTAGYFDIAYPHMGPGDRLDIVAAGERASAYVAVATSRGIAVIPATATLDSEFNAKRYGAVGDGVADDTAAIARAIETAGVGGQVVLPQGTYRLTSFAPLEGQTILGVSHNTGTGSIILADCAGLPA
jgi:polygalacturonase